MSYHERTQDAAKGKWRGILMTLGLPDKCLTGKHCACPICGGGTDRFRWDNKDGRGTYICSQCGAGDGMKLAIEYTGKQFKDVAAMIDGMVGNMKIEAPRREMNGEDIRNQLRDTYRATKPIQVGDVAHKYLASRGIDELIYPGTLRFAPKLRDGEGGIRPAMVAMVGVYGSDKFSGVHKTFLNTDGTGKAEMTRPRKFSQGSIPDGACVAFGEYIAGCALGIAEGIETAMSASALYDMPVWAALNAAMLSKWVPPDGCTDVAIFGDCDANFKGQLAAYQLANKLSMNGVTVTVHIPDQFGEDYNNILQKRKAT